MKVIKLLIVTPLGILGACAPAGVSGSVAVSAPLYTGAPALAYVAPGVEVVTDWGTPVFFADDFFWYWDGGVWFRSSVLGGERIRVREVPHSLARVEHPENYSHFRPVASAMRPVPEARMHAAPRMALRRR